MNPKTVPKLLLFVFCWFLISIGLYFLVNHLLKENIKKNFLSEQSIKISQNLLKEFKQTFPPQENELTFWTDFVEKVKNFLKAQEVTLIDIDNSLIASTNKNLNPQIYLQDQYYRLSKSKNTPIPLEQKDKIILYTPFPQGEKTLFLRIALNKYPYYHELNKLVNFENILLLFFLILSIFFLGLSFSIWYIKEKEKKRVSAEDTALIEALAYQAEGRDLETGKHLERTKLYVYHLANYLRKHKPYKKIITSNYLQNLVKASIIHDIGKVAVPESILFKRGKLSVKEFDLIKEHCLYGAKIINRAKSKYPNSLFLTLAMEIILYHHERFDGTGYPKGLKGENIPLSARIMALVDVYDAMRSKKCYKEPLEHEQCVRYILSQKGMHFDPVIVDAFYALEKTFLKISLDYADRYDIF